MLYRSSRRCRINVWHQHGEGSGWMGGGRGVGCNATARSETSVCCSEKERDEKNSVTSNTMVVTEQVTRVTSWDAKGRASHVSRGRGFCSGWTGKCAPPLQLSPYLVGECRCAVITVAHSASSLQFLGYWSKSVVRWRLTVSLLLMLFRIWRRCSCCRATNSRPWRTRYIYLIQLMYLSYL